jgi:hypothetical protein
MMVLPAWAQGGGTATTRLRSFDEVPAISSLAEGRFTLSLNGQGTSLTYELSYSGLRGNVTQAHIHVAQPGVNGGIVIFLCSNLGNGPAGTQSCPASGTISGTVAAANVVGSAAAQGVAAGELARVVRAMRNGVTYVNVHSTLFPGGEIRGQLKLGRGSSGEGDAEAEAEGVEDHMDHMHH